MNYFGLDDWLPIRIEPYFYFEYEMGRREITAYDKVKNKFDDLHAKLFKLSLGIKGDKLAVLTYYAPNDNDLEQLFSSLKNVRKLEHLTGYLGEYVKQLHSLEPSE
jgi:hypothetical protein